MVRSFFSVISYIIAILITGRYYTSMANLLGFLHSENWQNFIGFFIVLVIVSIILAFIFYLPRKISVKIWPEGIISRLIGGLLNVLTAAIGLVILTLLISAYPVWDWLQQAMANSGAVHWLVSNLGFIQDLLPEAMRSSIRTF